MNVSIRDFKRHTCNDKTQDVIKGTCSALESKPEDKECVQHLDKTLAGKSLKELEGINDIITDKSSEKLERVNEEKESTSNESSCDKKSMTQAVAELERGAGNRNEGITIKEMQGLEYNNPSNVIVIDDTQSIYLGINNALG